MDQYDFLDAGHRVFGLNGGNPDGSCKCGNPECKAAFKHPIASNWQHTPDWSEDQLEVMEMTGQFSTGYGVLVSRGLLVIDVDARNGGVESFGKLCEALQYDLLGTSGLAVRTGSGGGSMHLYYKAPVGVSLLQHHNDYPGIDFKSSGFVVGPGSSHSSGNQYEAAHGHPDDIDDAPLVLIEALTRPDTYRADYHGAPLDVTEEDLAGMLACVSPDCDHDTWIKCGMSVHHATGGTGFELWDEWSSKGKGYPGRSRLEPRWHSFGKSANPVTLGTLAHHAEEGGWQQPVTFTPTVFFDDVDTETRDDGHPFSINGVDLLRPPGFVGDICKWVNDQCRFPRESLAVASALVAMGNVCGLRYTDDVDGVNANLFAMCVAGSATGKEAVQQAITDIHRAAGIQGATHGAIKSEQEIMRNLISNQAAFYVIDEFGLMLRKVVSATERGGAAYLEGVIGALMSAYSKANSFMLLNGDTKRDVRNEINSQLKSARTAVSDNEDPTGSIARRIPQLQRALEGIDNGLERPFLSLIGFTTAVTFDSLVTFEQATNGFIGRSVIVSEKETNPRAKKGFKARAMPDQMKMSLAGLYDGGYFDPDNQRVEFYGDRTAIRTDKAAVEMLDQVADWAHERAEMHKERTGMEAIPRRAREMVSKISLILGAPSGVRTSEHVRWAYAFVNRDIEEKTRLAFANQEEKSDPTSAVMAKVLNLVDADHGETAGVIVNRCRKWPKTGVMKVLGEMVSKGLLKVEATAHPVNGKDVEKYFAGPNA